MCVGRPVWQAILPRINKSLPPDVVRDSMEHNWPSFSTTLENCILRHDVRPSVEATLAIPTLLVHATNDATAPLANIQRLTASYPNLRLVVLNGADHNMFLTHTRQCLNLITDQAERRN